MMFEFDININTLFYSDIKCTTLHDRYQKAKLLSGFTQKELCKLTGLSQSTINDFGKKDFTVSTLKKLLTILNKNILCDDYCNFILNQGYNMKKLINKYGIKKLSALLCVHRSTIERYRDEKYQIKISMYKRLEKL